jgi:hypothetical protein
VEGNTVLYALIIVAGMVAAASLVLLIAWVLAGRRQVERPPENHRSIRAASSATSCRGRVGCAPAPPSLRNLESSIGRVAETEALGHHSRFGMEGPSRVPARNPGLSSTMDRGSVSQNSRTAIRENAIPRYRSLRAQES